LPQFFNLAQKCIIFSLLTQEKQQTEIPNPNSKNSPLRRVADEATKNKNQRLKTKNQKQK